MSAMESVGGGGAGKLLLTLDEDLPAETQAALAQTLFRAPAVLAFMLFTTFLVAVAGASRSHAPAFVLGAAVEGVFAVASLVTLARARRAPVRRRSLPIDPNLFCILGWAAAVGWVNLLAMTGGDWPVAVLAALASGGAAAGLGLRSHGAPRFVGLGLVLMLAPLAIGGLFSGQPILVIASLQVATFAAVLVAMSFQLSATLIRALRAEREIERHATHDPLTGTLNRAGICLEAERMLAAQTPFALLYLDVTRVGGVTDLLGHQAGDVLRRSVGRLLGRLCAGQAWVGRPGGDQFILLLPCRGRAAAAGFARSLVAAIERDPFRIGSESASVGAVVGIAIYPEHGNSFGSLLAEADAALFRLQADQGGSCLFADAEPPLHRAAVRRARVVDRSAA